MRVPVTERNAILTQADGSSWALSTERFTEAPTRWLLIDIVGWYGGSGVRSTVTDRYRHGDFPSRGWREGRTISLRGAAISKTSMTRDDVERELSGILWDGQEGTLAVQEADDRVLWTTVRLDGAPSIEKLDERAIEFSIPLRSSEAFVYGPWREGTLTLPGAGVGLEYPLFTGGRMSSSPNLIGDPTSPEMRDQMGGSQWLWSPSGYWTRSAVNGSTTQFNAYPVSATSYDHLPLTPGETYRVSYDAWIDVADDSMRARTAVYYKKTDESTSFVGDGPIGDDTLVSGEWVHVERFWTAPDDAASGAFAPQLLYTAADATEVRIRNVRVETTEPVLTFGAAIDTEVTMWNNGNATSYPQIEVVGDLPGGFAVTVGSRRVTYPWPTFPDMPVLVDMSGSLSVSGQDQSHRLVERNWTGIEPGTAETPKLDPLQGGTGWAVVRHRDTYI